MAGSAFASRTRECAGHPPPCCTGQPGASAPVFLPHRSPPTPTLAEQMSFRCPPPPQKNHHHPDEPSRRIPTCEGDGSTCSHSPSITSKRPPRHIHSHQPPRPPPISLPRDTRSPEMTPLAGLWNSFTPLPCCVRRICVCSGREKKDQISIIFVDIKDHDDSCKRPFRLRRKKKRSQVNV